MCLSCQTDTSELQITEVMIRVRQAVKILITWFNFGLLLGEASSGCTCGDRAFQSSALRSPPLHRKTFASLMWQFIRRDDVSVSVNTVSLKRPRQMKCWTSKLMQWPHAEALKRWRCVSLCRLYVVQGIDSRKLLLCKSSKKEIRCHQRLLLTSTVHSRLIVRILTSRYFSSKYFSRKLRNLECSRIYGGGGSEKPIRANL